MFKYFPHTEADLEAMLAKVGVKTIDDLFKDVPKGVFFQRDFDVQASLSEVEIRAKLKELAAQNRQYTCFAGLGVYDHYEPSVISSLISRQEFLTAYTPYQPEEIGRAHV
mgnify:FL=1